MDGDTEARGAAADSTVQNSPVGAVGREAPGEGRVEGPDEKRPGQPRAEDDAAADFRGPPEERLRLSIGEPGDALALVQHTLGFMPEDSLVIIGLTRGTTGAHLRVDLAAAADDPGRLARWAADCLGGAETDPGADGSVVLFFGDEAPAPPMNGDEALRPHAALCGALEAEMSRRRMPVVQTWIVGGGSIRDYHCPDADCCPYPGQDVETAAHSVLNTHMVYRGRRALRTPTEITEAFLDDRRPMPAERDAVAAHVPDRPPGPGGPDSAEHALAVWECSLDDELAGRLDDPEDLHRWYLDHGEDLAAAASALADRQVRDALLVQAAVGVAPALAGLRVSRSAAPGETPGEALERLEGPSGPPPQLVSLVGEFEAAFLGATGRRPDWARIDALETLLSRLHHAVDDDVRAEVLAMVGWIEWARGRGSVAGAYLDRCRELEPAHGLADLLERAMALGGICPWARVREHSWSYGRGDSAG
ncbi:DUF4192 domain-containing protein [Nesterenkonia sp. F]|uniref:DUF4192 domain-containing protein n=1 Tax=Nesterenkonia sp. F TaxID=795955 RepID=UPI001111B83B|nr:DUF4192 domain-containing protein [Nesterenkonia sp. F]